MASLHNKHVLLGITGSIAAYKSAELVRRLVEAGAQVQVVMTRAAMEFITPLTLQTLSGHPVRSELMDARAEASMGHIELARWADLVLVAPASADFIARLVQGRGDDLLGALCLASEAPLAIAPAMNRVMWADAATQANIERLRERKVSIFGPASGEQACGETGEGRMLEPLELVEQAAGLFATGSLAGVRVVITAGPTREAIDPMRFISNRSSGKMGYALAEACVEAGARVTLVSGPVCLPPPERVIRVDVESAAQMHEAVQALLADTDLFISAAAVADYRPDRIAAEKIKKDTADLRLEMIPTVDILASVGTLETAPFTVGFAAETGNMEAHARGKLAAKRLDMIAANEIGTDEQGRPLGFEADDNALHVYWADGEQILPRAPKRRLARQLVELIAQRYHEKRSG
ncbi:MAG: bifunctional phosphopantothenoylcysteine decarboxylase/phosphopantothenate--cysteine ligase CoaBC [Granulosicoccaceae bacterium]|jgi:phosphopantothenoylcysteine decarboxylase/phosphopantothenate--cysteine ligase